MISQPPSYRDTEVSRHIIRHAVWRYSRFGLSVRDVDDLLADRGIAVTYPAILR